MKRNTRRALINCILIFFIADTVPVERFGAPLNTLISPARAEEIEEDTVFKVEDGIAHRVKPGKDGGPDTVADSNIQNAMEAILRERKPAPALKRATWNHSSDPLYLKMVSGRFGIRGGERKMLYRNGFVVSGKQRSSSYGFAYHDIYQSQLPVYVTVDSILNALFLSHDAMLADIETRILAPALKRILTGLREKLPARAAYYPHDSVKDLEVYIAVALSLLENGAVAGRYDNDADVKRLTGLAMAGASLAEVELFGRNRMADFTQYTPRGHYTDEALQGYFRAAMWLSRLEFNIDSRSCRSSQPGEVPDPAQTPREVVDALALADLAAFAGVDGDIEMIDRAWGLFAGPREDIPLKDLALIEKNAGITALLDPSAADAFIKAVADRYKRTVNTHYMPGGTTELPAICTMIGPRITADNGAIKSLIDPEVPERHMIGAADIAYSLGNDRSARYLDGEIRKYPALGKKLADARAAAARSGGSDLFALWLTAVRNLSDKPRGVVPSMMDTPAYEDLRLNSTVAAYAQIRHNYALMAAQNYDFGGCRIPDGYVEPAPKVFEALMKYAERGGSVLAAIDTGNATGGRAYLARFAGTVRVLNVIAERELENRPLSAEMKRFLSMIAEMEPGGTGGPPLYNGWYFDLFYRRADALKESYFIADYYTSTYQERIAYAGTAGLETGIFVIDTCGAPRLAVGPVPRSFDFTGPLAKRLDDSAVAALAGKRSPWSANYTVAVKTREPALYFSCSTYSGEDRKQKITFYSPKKLKAVEIELLDHNRKRIMILTRTIGPGKTVVAYSLPKKDAVVEIIHIRYGDFDHWSDESQMGTITSTIGGCELPSDFSY